MKTGAKLKTGAKSLDQKVGMMTMLDSVIDHWNTNPTPEEFADILRMFKQNLQQHIDFLEAAE